MHDELIDCVWCGAVSVCVCLYGRLNADDMVVMMMLLLLGRVSRTGQKCRRPCPDYLYNNIVYAYALFSRVSACERTPTRAHIMSTHNIHP